MFTGIIQMKGVVLGLEPSEAGRVLRIDPRGWGHRPTIGESIAVSGCCLTVAGTGPSMRFDIVPETLKRTTLGDLKQGDRVNLEHAATPGTLLGGHIVQGHVDGVGTAKRISSDDHPERRLRIEPPGELLDYIIPQGSITVEGVSLTIAEVTDGTFDVVLIPTTIEHTTLGRIDKPTPVNLEADCLAKMVIEHLRRTGPAARPAARKTRKSRNASA